MTLTQERLDAINKIALQVKDLPDIWINHKRTRVPKNIGLTATVTQSGGILTAIDRDTGNYKFSLTFRMKENRVISMETFYSYLIWDALYDGADFIEEDQFLIIQDTPFYHAMIFDFENYTLTTVCKDPSEVSGSYVCEDIESLYMLFLEKMNK